MPSCSSFILTTKDDKHFLARTMDFTMDMTDAIILVPRKKKFITSDMHSDTITTKYSFLGIGRISNSAPITFDGINEKGLTGAALYFPDYAAYEDDKKKGTTAVDPDKIVPVILGVAADLDEVAEQFRDKISIINNPDPFLDTEPPMHFIFTDTSGKCLIIEPRESGIDIIEDSIGVLANSPDYRWHETNLTNYYSVKPTQHAPTEILGKRFSAVGEGSGTLGIPGDYTPPSRFIRTALGKQYTTQPETEEEAVTTAHHILETVSVPRGIVVADTGESDYTSYASYMCADSLTYYFSTHNNQRIQKITLTEELQQTEDYQIIRFKKDEDILDLNVQIKQ